MDLHKKKKGDAMKRVVEIPVDEVNTLANKIAERVINTWGHNEARLKSPKDYSEYKTTYEGGYDNAGFSFKTKGKVEKVIPSPYGLILDVKKFVSEAVVENLFQHTRARDSSLEETIQKEIATLKKEMTENHNFTKETLRIMEGVILQTIEEIPQPQPRETTDTTEETGGVKLNFKLDQKLADKCKRKHGGRHKKWEVVENEKALMCVGCGKGIKLKKGMKTEKRHENG